MAIYNYKVDDITGKKISLRTYEDHVVLIVNTASKCGFTPQFEGLETLYQKYKEQNFVVLGFPCNQFKEQDPYSNDAIGEFCRLNYGVTFPMFSKIEVNGKNADPLFTYLKLQQKGLINQEIKWNFTKFLVDREGNVVSRYGPTVKPSKIESDVIKLLWF